MIEYEGALKTVLTDVPLIASERVPMTAAWGRVLSAPVVAPCAIPRLDSSAMDGYAVRAEECAQGRVLRVFGEARAGQVPQQLEPGTAMRVFTGAAVPTGANAVIMQEHVRVIDQDMQAGVAVRRGDNLRRAGEDLRLGGEALVEGTRVTAGVQMLASSLDQTEFAVAGQPRVTLVCTGDELRAIGLMGGIASIPESNSIGICALAHQAGALVNVAPLVVDDPRALARVLAIALDRCDLLVTIGGASVGEHDYVKAALEAADVAFDFCKVAIKPGKPVAFGRKGRGRVLALPGNPASALVTFALFGMPLLRSMQGDAQPAALRYTVPISTRMRRTSERLTLALGRTLFVGTRYEFVAHPNQSSGAVIALGNSNGMAFIGPGESPCEAETPVEFIAWSSL